MAAPAPGEHIVLVGAGFGGLACAKALGGSRHHVTVIDRNNFHLFVPLLYQVATAALSPADVAAPIRMLLRRHDNIEVLMGEVERIDPAARNLRLTDGLEVTYDRLVISTGSEYSYFGHEEWRRFAPGLRHLPDARQLRTRLLRGFELAERECNPRRQRPLMTSIIVGGGPTGVEMAGAIAELTRLTLARDFRRIDPAAARVILIESGARILPAFPADLAQYAHARLAGMGVDVRCGTPVSHIDPEGVRVGDQFIEAHTVTWAAGIRASQLAAALAVTLDQAGRVPVEQDLSVKGLLRVYALGDIAAFPTADGKLLPALAQVAKQQGEHLGRAIAQIAQTDERLPVFRFQHRGNTAVIGRSAAIFDFGRRKLRGFSAWLLWAIVHVYLLVSFEQRTLVSLRWLWRFFTYQAGARIIVGDEKTGEPARKQETGAG